MPRTYTVVNPIPALVGLMERTFGVVSWPIATFGNVVPLLTDPTVAAAQAAHETAIITYRAAHHIPDNGIIVTPTVLP